MIYFITIFVATLFSSSLFSQTNCQEARQKYWMLYPDVANAKFDPYQHYQIHGKNEGRVWPACKGEEKDCENAKSQYYKLYPDVFNAGADAWTHYQTYGIKEGRVWPFCYSVSTSTLSVHSQSEVKIGNQIWMTKNLDVDRFRNGDPIPQAKNIQLWIYAGTNKQPAWCYYEFDENNGKRYGKLYNWYAVSDSRGLAPKGYHIPSEEEWTNLKVYLGRSIGGKKMKSKEGWKSYQEGDTGDNSSGFSGLPGGYLLFEGFYYIGEEANWWSSTENCDARAAGYYGRASFLTLSSGRQWVTTECAFKGNGYSVRCLRD